MLRILLVLIVWLLIGEAGANALQTLSLNDAILLAIRENPNVQIAQLNHVREKYALAIQQWQFLPHFTFNATRTTSQTYAVTADGLVTENKTGIEPSVSLLTPIGTQATLTAANNLTNHYNPGLSLEVVQPLMRGFGRPIVEAALYNAMDSEKISRLTVDNTLRTTITAVINAYLDVVAAQNTLQVDQDALVRAQNSVQQTQLFIKAGHKAGVELITVQADVANAQTRIENDKNSLQQTRYALLTQIGLDPNTKVAFTTVNIPYLIKKYQIPALTSAKELALNNDIQYQVDQITFKGATKRNLQQAEDNTRWQLNLTASGATGNGVGGGQNSGINSLVNGVSRTDSLMLNLTIPIDDRAAKNNVANAKIAIREAALGLQQEKWNKETNAINGWNTIYSAERALHLAQNAEQLQLQAYHISLQKYNFGLIDSLELQTSDQQLIASGRQLVSAQINYLKALVSFDQMLGKTLQTWHIQVQYD